MRKVACNVSDSKMSITDDRVKCGMKERYRRKSKKNPGIEDMDLYDIGKGKGEKRKFQNLKLCMNQYGEIYMHEIITQMRIWM